MTITIDEIGDGTPDIEIIESTQSNSKNSDSE